MRTRKIRTSEDNRWIEIESVCPACKLKYVGKFQRKAGAYSDDDIIRAICLGWEAAYSTACGCKS